VIGPGLAGSSFNAYAYGYETGLAGTITVSIEDSDGNVVLAPVTTPIIEIDVGGNQSVYRYIGTFPPIGEYVLIWENPDGVQAVEELVSGTTVVTPSDGPLLGPCQPWITADDVAECCGIEPSTADEDLATAALMASDLLYRLSAKKFPGICVRTVRPCRSGCGCSHVGEGWYWRGSDWGRVGVGRACGCGCVSQITLSGTVRAIVEVLIDGEIVAPDSYRLDEFKYLVRMADADGFRQSWPRCQRLDLPSTEGGTFEITYLSGLDVPTLGVQAAAALACELYRACPSVQGDCALPVGVTRIVRQGLTIEKIDSLGMMLRRGATGLPLVDTFMAAYNPSGALLGPMVWSPDMPTPRRVG